MPKRKSLPTAQRIWEQYDYKPLTGELVAKRYAAGSADRRRTGSRKVNRYLSVWLDNQPYCAHRMVWKWVHGTEPGDTLDHLNRDGHDNRIWNLREVTQTENLKNRVATWKHKPASKGYSWCEDRRRWMVYLRIDGTAVKKTCATEKEAQVYVAKMRAAQLYFIG